MATGKSSSKAAVDGDSPWRRSLGKLSSWPQFKIPLEK
jgi:hypothetical protein